MQVPFFARSNGDWIRSTPACDGSTLYTGGMRDVLVATDCQSGQEKWRIDFPKELNSELPTFGFVCSPLIDDGKLYVQAGGGLVAIDCSTGKVLWRSLQDGGGMNGSAFSSPTMETLHGRRQLLVQTRTHLTGVDPASGDKIWEKEIQAFRGMNILTPMVWQDCVFTSSYGGKSLLLEFDPSPKNWQVKARWENKKEGYMSSPIIIEDHVYLHLRNKRFTCIDLKTGEDRWTTQTFGQYWSMISNGQQMLALDQLGKLFLIQHDPSSFQLLDQREVSKEECWAHLAMVDGKLLVRDLKGIQCFQWM
jgi:outer membrane protein assembly factor BamB